MSDNLAESPLAPAPDPSQVGTPGAAIAPTGQALREAILRGMPADKLTQTFGGTPSERRVYADGVDLTGVDYPHRLVLQYCDFHRTFVAEDARFKNTVDLSHCTFEEGLNLAGAVCEGGLNLLDVRAAAIPGQAWPSSIIEKGGEQWGGSGGSRSEWICRSHSYCSTSACAGTSTSRQRTSAEPCCSSTAASRRRST